MITLTTEEIAIERDRIKEETRKREKKSAEFSSSDPDLVVKSPTYKTHEAGSEAWLVTFTDIIALMLTFFVLLFSMSVPDEGVFDEVAEVRLDANKFMGHQNFAGDKDAVAMSTKTQMVGLDLGYLSTLIEQAGAANPLMRKAEIIRNADRLVIILPESVKFESGSTTLSSDANDLLRDLAGTLSNITNQIVVVGHADPAGAEAPEDYWVNWAISLERAQQVAMVLARHGVSQNLVIRGISNARFNELPADLSYEERLQIARRVDIIIQPNQAQ
tara:strand:+ start:32781 stop:33602 length:822 start_codon:yes stop_codon:yes gene_type:complete